MTNDIYPEEKAPLQLLDEILSDLVQHALEELPNIACGIIGGRNGIATKSYRTVNEKASPTQFSIAPKDLLRVIRDLQRENLQMIAVYSSRSKAVPTSYDVSLARETWPLSPNVASILVSVTQPDSPTVRAFMYDPGMDDLVPHHLEVDGIVLEDA